MRAYGYPCAKSQAPFERREFDVAKPGPEEAVVRVAGCGLCHTDISFAHGDVQPRHAFPLTLGHEISGVVEIAGERFRHLQGKKVIVPAVMPCGACVMCKAGFDGSCRKQFMPGNDGDGGFASHLTVPAQHLCVLPDTLAGYELAELSVIADAVTTPYQSIVRSNLKPGEVAIVIGTGGIGTYGVQIAKAFGAHVVAVDINDEKLTALRDYGASVTFNCAGKDAGQSKKAIREMVKQAGLPDFGWKIFEMSGTAAGQELAFNLIPPAGTMAVVGFTMDIPKVRLSNLMALDATCFGNWGCSPRHYPAVVDLVLSGKITLKPFIQRHPLTEINALFELAHRGQLTRRAILVP
ncbi:MAG: 6-hydroxycyclohex-1-ene-1-carbonyl-CoA dehydrogenase [Planctomycetes bacterium]|nr:6-hydroxycyclohex-1-ene-1-carbonyl-CoA dehydrogenase [Planctomycetota bacterium]NUQ34950.1 6-hydroxycyclohex-1-ene-1-carbonyl-CoA dehydrogenase [Planctomycetaceae bacterium]